MKYATPSDINILVNYNPDCHYRTVSKKRLSYSTNATITMCVCTITYTGYFDRNLDDTIFGELLCFDYGGRKMSRGQ
jgi:hypothetical protein